MTSIRGKPAGPIMHPLREDLSRELHARPFPVIEPPAEIVQFVLVHHGTTGPSELDHLAALCREHSLAPPTEGVAHFSTDCPGFRLTWERHSEFSTYTFVFPGAFSSEVLDRMLPRPWLERLSGQLMAATGLKVVVAPAGTVPPAVVEWFGERDLVGGLASGGRVRLWTDFDLDPQGFMRIVAAGAEYSARQIGRLVQRLLEVHAYTMMALLALPLARSIAPSITSMEQSLAEVADDLPRARGPDDEQKLLDRLSALAAAVETLSAQTPFRFGAARAYHALVERRVAELRETRIEGHQTLAEFFDRRLTPAMRTCETTHERLGLLSERVARASEMLRTRIDVVLAAQNRDLLASMDRRVKLQLRLQATVEGLSIAAITYYFAGLLGYLAQAAAALGWHVSKELLVGGGIPIIALLCWIGLRRLHKRLNAGDL